MIVIGCPEVIHIPEVESHKLVYPIDFDEDDGDRRFLTFQVADEYAEYLVTDRADAPLTAILHYACMHNEDIVLKQPVSSEFYYKLVTYLIPTLKRFNDGKADIKIICDIISTPIESQGMAAAGASRGVDGLYTIFKNTSPDLQEDMRLSYLILNNSHPDTKNDYPNSVEDAKQVAEELKLKLILPIDNYLDDVFPETQHHVSVHFFSSLFVALCLRKLIGTYYFASAGLDFSSIKLKDCLYASPYYYIHILLITFSFNGFNLISDGNEIDRFEKIERISDWNIAQKYLNVCGHRGDNCSTCYKCKRTLLTLDCIDKLDSFKNVFDIELYKENRTAYLQDMIRNINVKSPGSHSYMFNKMIYDRFVLKEPDYFTEHNLSLDEQAVATLENIALKETIERLKSRIIAVHGQNVNIKKRNKALVRKNRLLKKDLAQASGIKQSIKNIIKGILKKQK